MSDQNSDSKASANAPHPDFPHQIVVPPIDFDAKLEIELVQVREDQSHESN
jgi:hypothetical protein